jgi:hypothetical protein
MRRVGIAVDLEQDRSGALLLSHRHFRSELVLRLSVFRITVLILSLNRRRLFRSMSNHEDTSELCGSAGLLYLIEMQLNS